MWAVLTLNSLISKKRIDRRTRQDRILRRNQAFAAQLDGMVQAYLDWNKALGVSGKGVAAPLANDVVVQDVYYVKVVDIFGES